MEIENKITIEELQYTYRKVKRELYYEKESIYIQNIINYEDNLNNNLNKILNAIEKQDIDFFLKKVKIGEHNFIYKSIKVHNEKTDFKIKYSVENLRKKLFSIDDISFRYMADISITFQMIGGLWMNRIGYLIDELLPQNLYGCRLKSHNKKLNLPYYTQNHTFYKPYFNDYKRWQNDLFKEISNNSHEDIQVFTADITKYYHSIYIEVLKEKVQNLIDENNIGLCKHNLFLNKLLFEMILRFNDLNNKEYNFFENKGKKHDDYGLPLTLNASRILSNIYLLDFDQDLIGNSRPLYYGRYVDDFIIALKCDKPCEFTDVFIDLKRHSITKGEKEGDNGVVIYTLQSNEKFDFKLEFNSDKQKSFLLNDIKDSVEINHLRKSINKTSSEWKLLPTTLDYENIDKIDLFYTINSECETTTNIRKSGDLILKRNKFIKEILNFESYINNSSDEIWKKRLINFLTITNNYIFDLKNFIDLNKYIPRLFGLLIHCNNEGLIKKYFQDLESVLNSFKENTIDEDENKHIIASKFLKSKIKENILQTNSLKKINSVYAVDYLNMVKVENTDFLDNVRKYFSYDFHVEPYKNCYFKYEEYACYIKGNLKPKYIKKKLVDFSLNKKDKDIEKFIVENLHLEKCRNACVKCNTKSDIILASTGFYYFTRRISLLELSIAFKNLVIKEEECFIELSKFYYHDLSIESKDLGNQLITIDFPNTKKTNNPIICNTHFLTKDESFNAVVRGFKEPDGSREDRILKLVNDIISSKQNIDYLVFHELSLPRNLYLKLADKLAQCNINLIAGLEYKINKSNKTCDNQLVYILNVDEEYGGSIALFQSKMIGAVHEESELSDRAGLRIKGEYESKLIVKHNNFIFSGLICNDVLDINNRSPLRGKVDCLFILAWNTDLETYHHVVKSSSLDLHCFVSLSNNRTYGDTRIRGPYKKEYQRDIQRIHGGDHDSFLISTIDIHSLRDHHTNKVAPPMPFKPLPTGFKVAERRRKKQ